MLAALHVLAALGESDGTLSALMADYERYAASGEINSTVADAHAEARRDQGAVRLAGRRDASDELDGLTVGLPDGSWFNLRPSNTEPLLRLNVEAAGRRGDGRPARRGPRGRPRLTSTSGPRRRPVPVSLPTTAPPTGVPLVRLGTGDRLGGTAGQVHPTVAGGSIGHLPHLPVSAP